MTEPEILRSIIKDLKKEGIIKNRQDMADALGYDRVGTISDNINKNPLNIEFLTRFCAIYKIPIERIRPGVLPNEVNDNINNIQGSGNTAVAGNGNHVNSVTEKFLDLLKKKDEQMDRVLGMMESVLKRKPNK